jgi:serine/threonine protein kinase
LGKLTQRDDIQSELAAARTFKDIPAARKYFILPELDTLCTPAPRDQQQERDLVKCDAVQKFGYEDMQHVELEYGGKSLHTRLEDLHVAIREFPFWTFMPRILEIGTFLTLHGYIHNDLHSNNILLNASFVPRLIDFGRAYRSNAITDALIVELGAQYMPELSQVAPESTTQDGLAEGIAFEKICQDLKAQKPGILYAERYLGVSREAQIQEFRRFWQTSRAAKNKDWLSLWKTYWPTVDSWALGSILLGVLRKLLISKEFTESSEWKTKQTMVKTVLRGMLRTSPRERLDCVEALAMYDPTNELVTGEDGRMWLEKKRAQRAKRGGGDEF